MSEAWCILGNYNSILYKEDRMGGNEVANHELEDLNNLLHLWIARDEVDRGLLLLDKQDYMEQNR